MITRHRNRLWTAVTADGTKTTIDPSASTPSTEKLKVIAEYYLDSRKKTFEREDSTFITIEGGKATVAHSDGTHIVVTPKSADAKFLDEAGQFKLPPACTTVVEKTGYATSTGGLEKEQNYLILPNKTTIRRGVKLCGKAQETFVFLEKSNLSIEADTLGHLVINARSHSIKDPGFKTVLKLNWLEGSLEMSDGSGTQFQVTKNGDTSIQKTPVSHPSSPAQPLGFPAGRNLASLLSEETPLPSPFPGNTPRLFVIYEDGSGVELLRDDRLVGYFKDRLRDTKTEIIEEVSQDNDGVSLVSIRPANVVRGTAGSLIYRQVRFLDEIIYYASF